MPHSNAFSLGLVGTVLCLSFLGIAQQPEQIPQLVDQTPQGLGYGKVIWSVDEKWIATSDQRGGGVQIYDVGSGHLFRNIAVASGWSAEMHALPADRIAISSGSNGGSIDVYDVTSGTRVFTATNSEGCSIYKIRNEEIIGTCTTSNKSMLHPYVFTQRVWSVTTGAQLREETIDYRNFTEPLQDGTWIAETKMKMPSAGKQILSSFSHLNNNSKAVYSLFHFTITDTANGQVLMEGSGSVLAISQKGNSAVATIDDGVFLIQVPSGKRIQRLGAGPMNPVDRYSAATTVVGGTQYLVSGLTRAELIDAATGEVKTKIEDLPVGAGVVSPSGNTVAYEQGGAVLLVNIPDVTQRKLIGSQSAQMISASAAAKVYQSAQSASVSTNQKEQKKQMKEEGKQAEKEERDFEKTLPKFNARKRAQMEEDRQLDAERKELNSSRDKENSPAMQSYAAETWKAYMKFGAPGIMAPEVDFLDSGRVMAVLAADLSWNTWDVATGNRLPFKTKPPDAAALQQIASESGSAQRRTSEVYEHFRDELATIFPGNTNTVKKLPPPTASNDVACRSQSGAFLVDFKLELDPKKWRNGKHDVGSAILRSASGATVDLLANGIDLSALADNPESYEASAIREKPRCALSDDGRYLVLEQLRPDSAQHKHRSMSDKVREQVEGKQSSDSLVLYETKSGKQVCELEGSRDVDTLAGDVLFSKNNRYMAAGSAKEDPLHPGQQTPHDVRLWETQSCKQLFDNHGYLGDVIGFSTDDTRLYVGTSSKEFESRSDYGVQALDVQSGKSLLTIPDAASNINLINTTPNGRILFGPDRDNALGFWDSTSGERLASMRALQEGEWLITTPSGYFDGSPRGWTQIAWRLPGQGLTTQAGEIFFNEFYRPGLLSELLQGRLPSPPRTIQQVDRRQPLVRVSASESKVADHVVKIVVSVEEAPPDDRQKEPSGVRDVRLFRNGTLVKVWRGDAKLQGGKATFETTVPIASGETRFVAYAFNRDNVKSADATVTVESTASRRTGTAYILSVGVNQYANPEFDLKFAVPDAETLGDRFGESQKQLATYQNLIRVNLLDAEATKANILLALSLLSGKHQGAFPLSVPKNLSELKPVQPEDAVIVYFAGHGIAWGDRFYLVPHDMDYTGPRIDVVSSIQRVLASCISDQDLEEAFEPMQSGHSLLIIDACNSGKALDSEEQRRGPMNNRGLAQLAYEKGIYVLTAAQGYQAALESSRLGHGYLTYALAEEGLKTGAADQSPADGKITAAEWFEYASRRVPELQMEAMRQAAENGRQLTFEVASDGKSSDAGRLQTPRFYYRRELTGDEIVVAIYK
jgi:uncharacterized caspase-like protein/WD40 repeat protein